MFFLIKLLIFVILRPITILQVILFSRILIHPKAFSRKNGDAKLIFASPTRYNSLIFSIHFCAAFRAEYSIRSVHIAANGALSLNRSRL